jgi:acetyl esterase/lipase
MLRVRGAIARRAGLVRQIQSTSKLRLSQGRITVQVAERPNSTAPAQWVLVLCSYLLIPFCHALGQVPGASHIELPSASAEKFTLAAGVAVDRDVVYTTAGPDEQKLDIYHPTSSSTPRPAVVFLHGGGWSAGGKRSFQRQAAYLAAQGYVCASINYRLSQEAPYPAALYDAKAAVRWMRANAQKYGIDPSRIAASGGSAGGQLAALIGTTADVKTMEGDRGNPGYSSAVQAVVVFNPLTDFVSALEETQSPAAVTKAIVAFLGGPLEKVPEVYMSASPIAHISSASPPFLFLHGSSDTTLPFSQSTEMRDALEAVGVRAELFTANGANHGFFNAAPFYQPTLVRMQRFLDSVFKEPSH